MKLFYESKEALTKKSNRGLIIYLLANFIGGFFSYHKRGNYTIPIILRFIFVRIIGKLLNILYLFTLKSSRENEYEADKYSAKLGYGESLIVALDLIFKIII